MSERTLDRLIRTGLAAVVVGAVLVGLVYFLDSLSSSPTLVERQIEAAEEAVREQPNEIGPRLLLADTYRSAERPDDALEQYEEVLSVEPKMRTAVLGRAEVLAEQGDLAEAAKGFELVIELSGGGEFAGVDPDLQSAFYGLGSLRLEQDDPKKAIAPLRKAVAVEPTDADAWYMLGKAALDAGKAGQAVAALQRAVQFVPAGWCEPYRELSEAYAAQDRGPHAEYAGAMVDMCEERTDQAAERLQALVSGPAGVEAMLGLGMIAEVDSDRPAAARWYRKVLAADDSNFNALSGLNRLGAAPEQAALPEGHPSTGEAQ